MLRFLPALGLLLLLVFSNDSVAQPTVLVARPPDWITLPAYEDAPADSQDESGGYYNLLVDEQFHLPRQAYYRRYVYKVYSEAGLENVSTISVTFDPEYEKLTFHTLDIVRGQNRIPLLGRIKPEVIKREKNLEAASYDGDYTAVYHVEDLQVGDLVEYSCTVTGFNPLFQNKFSRILYFAYSIPVGTIHYRILRAGSGLPMRSFGKPPQHRETKMGGLTEYVWTANHIKPVLVDDLVPGWYDPYDHVQVSEFGQWKDLSSWARAFYAMPREKRLLPQLSKLVKPDSQATVVSLIRFVQDEIRYLSLSQGIHSIKPHSPSQVLRQRYGDCKDKSVLLAQLLREYGLESNPVLVNTIYGKSLPDYLAAPNMFDHCIVRFRFQDSVYWVDPTLALQRGGLMENSVSRFYFGLDLSEEPSGLSPIPESSGGIVEVREEFFVDSLSGGARLHVQSYYSGDQANQLRNMLTSSSREETSKQYLNFYSNDYLDIENREPMKWESRDQLNSILTTENYNIRSFWRYDSANKQFRIDLYARNVASYLTKPNSKVRTAPLSLIHPIEVLHRIVVHMPEPWSVTESVKKVESDGFVYESYVSSRDSLIELIFKLRSKRPFLEPGAVKQHVAKLDEALNDLSFSIWYNASAGNSPKALSLPLLSVFLVAMLIVVLGFWRLYGWRPEARPAPVTYSSIGGWLTLPAIGLVLSPIIRLFQILDIDYFGEHNWKMLTDATYYAYRPALGFFVIMELLVNGALFFGIIYCAILFFSRRTQTPWSLGTFYVLSFLTVAIDMYLGMLFELATDAATQKALIQSGIAVLIWVPYLIWSDRSKGTFIVR